MYKDKSKQRLANKAIKQKARAKGVTLGVTPTVAQEIIESKSPGLQAEYERQAGVTAGVTDDMVDKLASSFWRPRLAKICNSFQESSHPDYMLDVWPGDYNMAQVCELLEITS